MRQELGKGATMRLLRGAMVSLVLLSTPAQAWEWRWPWASADESANKLFVETSLLFDTYEGIPSGDPKQFAQRLEVLTTIDANIRRIVTDYPESSLAVQLVSGSKVGIIDKADITSQISDLAYNIQCENDARFCIRMALMKIRDRQIKEYSERTLDLSLGITASSFAELEYFKDAMETALLISDNDRRVFAQAKAHAFTGDVEKSLEAARTISDTDLRDRALNVVATALTKFGKIKDALEAMQSIEEDSIRKMTQIQINWGMGRLGYSDDAINSLKGIAGINVRESILEEYSTHLMRYGECDGAERVAQLIADEGIRSEQMQFIKNCDPIRMVKASLAYARTVVGDMRSMELCRAALKQIRFGDIEGAKSTIVEALRSRDIINDGSSRAESAGCIAGAYMKENNSEEAVILVKDSLNELQGMEDASQQALALWKLAIALSEDPD